MKPETSEISYPLLNVYVLHKMFTNPNSITQLSVVTIQSICATEVIVSNEYKAFLSSLEMNGMQFHQVNNDFSIKYKYTTNNFRMENGNKFAGSRRMEIFHGLEDNKDNYL